MKSHCNKTQVVSITAYEEFPRFGVDYRKGLKFLGITIQKEGWYNYINNQYVTREKAYHKPHVEFKFSNGDTKTVRFETYQEAEQYANRMSKEVMQKIHF